jgi:hypothetical protein
MKMKNFDNDLEARRLVTLVFAFLSGLSAVFTAVAPAILHV